MLSRDWGNQLGPGSTAAGVFIGGALAGSAFLATPEEARISYCQGAEAYRRSNATKGF